LLMVIINRWTEVG